MNRYKIPCTEEQTRKARELGAPIEVKSIEDAPKEWYGKAYFTGMSTCAKIPTAEEMIGWLEHAKIEIDITKGIESYVFNLYFGQEYINGLNGYNTRQEATLAAIDAALEYLTNKK